MGMIFTILIVERYKDGENIDTIIEDILNDDKMLFPY